MIEIRPLNKDDSKDELISLSREFFGEYEGYHEDFFKIDRLTDGDIVNYFSHWIDNENGKAYIAFAEGKIVGYITIYVKPQANFYEVKEVGVVSGLMVAKAYRRKGIAKQLLAQAKTFFAEMGVRYFTVFTAAENQGALDFYASNGLYPLYTTMMGSLNDP